MRANQNQLLAQDVFTRVQGLRQGVSDAIINGYAYVPNAVSKRACGAMETEVAESHERAYLSIGDKNVPVATLVTRALSTELKGMRRQYPSLKDWMATEAGYQLYRNTDDHISPYRDRRNDRLLAATITINGSALVRIHETLDDPDDYTNLQQIDEFRASAGGVMLLRASGLGSGEQTIHEVLPPDQGSRLILNLRMRPDILKSPGETAVK